MDPQAIASAFDLANPPAGFVDSPYATFDALREHDPVHQNPDGSYILTRYQDLHDVYRNPAVWSSDKKIEFKPKFGDSPLFEHHTNSLVFRDPPDHSRIRKLFSHAFTPRALKALEGRIETLVTGYLDAVAAAGGMDAVGDFAFLLPVEVVCDMLGVPASDRLSIRDWSQAILGGLEPTLSDEAFNAGCAAVEEFKAYLRGRIAERRAHPDSVQAGEILGDLILAEEDGERLTEIELLHQCIFLLNAGHETSTNMLSHGIHELIRHPDQQSLLRQNPALINTCVDEVLRYQSPIQINNRRALEDTQVGGVALAKGALVNLHIGAANRDPAQFEQPASFDIARKPNRHLSFGTGIHICAGATLARMEGRIAFRALVQRFEKLELAGPIERSPRLRFRGIEALPITVA